MLGAIAGDVIGSVYERHPIKTTDFPLFQPRSRFTDDTVMMCAVAHAILSREEYGPAIKAFGRRYPGAGYGAKFRQWLVSPSFIPYGSWGNGSAMRVIPVGWAFDTVDAVLDEARKTAEVTHNHPEGIKGAQAAALAVYLARTGTGKAGISAEISKRFKYDLTRTLEEIRPFYEFEVSCQRSVPQSIRAFLESDGVEDAIRKAVSLGGDSDTMACIAGGIAEAFYGGVPEQLERFTRIRLPEDLLEVVNTFQERYCGR